MKQPEYSGNGWLIHNSDCIEGMHSMPENSVDCAIFSPPFGDLFVYSDSDRDLGNAGTGDDFMDQYHFFAEALTRVLRPGRIACVHCTDLPMRKARDGAIGLKDFSGELIKAHTDAGLVYHGRATIWEDPVVEMQRTKAHGLLYKNIRGNSTHIKTFAATALTIELACLTICCFSERTATSQTLIFIQFNTLRQLTKKRL